MWIARIAVNENSSLLFRSQVWDTLISMTVPQTLSRQAIDEFKAIYRDEFGNTLSDSEVHEIAMRLLRFFGVLVQHPLNRPGS
jgi:hypothetical protein